MDHAHHCCAARLATVRRQKVILRSVEELHGRQRRLYLVLFGIVPAHIGCVQPIHIDDEIDRLSDAVEIGEDNRLLRLLEPAAGQIENLDRPPADTEPRRNGARRTWLVDRRLLKSPIVR